MMHFGSSSSSSSGNTAVLSSVLNGGGRGGGSGGSSMRPSLSASSTSTTTPSFASTVGAPRLAESGSPSVVAAVAAGSVAAAAAGSGSAAIAAAVASRRLVSAASATPPGGGKVGLEAGHSSSRRGDMEDSPISIDDPHNHREEAEDNNNKHGGGSAGSAGGNGAGRAGGSRRRSVGDDDGDAVTCDLCGVCFLSQSDLLEHHKKKHMNEVEAEQAQLFRPKPPRIHERASRGEVGVTAGGAVGGGGGSGSRSSGGGVTGTSGPGGSILHRAASHPPAPLAGEDDTLARLQNRLGLSITPVPSAPAPVEGGTKGSNGNGPAVSAKPPGQRSGTIFKCRYCAYSTRVKQEYQRHEYIHKPISCELCPYKTIWKNDLNKHMVKYHGATPTEQDGGQVGALNDRSPEEAASSVSVLPSGGMLRNLLSTPETGANPGGSKTGELLLFKSIQQGSRDNSQQGLPENIIDEVDVDELHTVVQKTNAHYFCPYCDFMTKTASRFHIHYMQHLNVRPFECSACNLKSNYYWDINKHIRTRIGKGDRVHRGARCVCINEAGRRDYSKYDCFFKEGPANGEHIETSDEQAEAAIRASQARLHQGHPLVEPSMQAHRAQQHKQHHAADRARLHPAPPLPPLPAAAAAPPLQLQQSQQRQQQLLQKQQQQQQQQQQHQQQHRSKQLNQASSMQMGSRQVVQAQLASVPVGQLLSSQNMAVLQQQVQQRTNKLQEDSQNYMIQQLKQKERHPHHHPQHSAQQHQQQQQPEQLVQHRQLQQQQQAEVRSSTSGPNATAVHHSGALKCGHCEYRCDHKDIMLGHLGAHVDVLPFICSKCGLASKWHHTAWIHLQQVHRDEQVSLKDIHLQLNYRQNGNAFYINDSSQIVNKVLNLAPNQEMNLVRKLRCGRCPYRTVQKSNMQRHREGHLRLRPDILRFKCPYCDFYQETRRRIQRHMGLHPQHIKRGAQGVLDTNGVEGLDISATALAKIFGQLNAQRREDGQRALDEGTASLGSGNSTTITTNTTHDNNVNNSNIDASETVFRCDICPFSTTANAQFIYHKQFHRYNSKAKFKCDKCSYWAMHAHLITQHARVHQDGLHDLKFPEGSWLPPAEIAVTAEASASDSIRSFRVVKNGVIVKMHKCRFCPLMNRRKQNIRLHENVHNGSSSERYTCHLCSFKTHAQEALCQHLRSHVPQRARRDESSIETIEEIDDDNDASEDGRDDESYARTNASLLKPSIQQQHSKSKASQGSVVSNRPSSSRPQLVKKIKYNCSAVESELFNLLQSRQNGSSSTAADVIEIDDEQDMPVRQRPEVVRKSPKEASPKETSKYTSKEYTPREELGERRRDGLISYQNRANQRKWIACAECPALFASPNELKRHLGHHRLPNHFRCSKCSFSMNKPVYIQQHEQVHTEEYMVKKLGFCHRPTDGPGSRKHALRKKMFQKASSSSASAEPKPQTSVMTASTAAGSDQLNSSKETLKAPQSATMAKEKQASVRESMAGAPKRGEQQTKSEAFSGIVSDQASLNYASDEYTVALVTAELHESQAVFDGVATGQFKCSACPAAFTNQAVLRFHSSLHNSSPAGCFKCHVCSYSIDEKANMAAHAQLHYTRHHIARPALKQCPKCPATFTKQNFFEGHLLRHGSRERHRCEHCDFATKKYDVINRHRSLHDAAPAVVTEFATDDGLLLDANSQQSISMLFHNASVPQTLVEDAEPMTLDAVTKTPEPHELEDERRLYSCTVCPHSCARKDGMQHHIKRHLYRQQNVCPHCSFSNINPATLRDHVKTHFVVPKIVRPQAFLHYDDLKIRFENGELLFEDRGRLDPTRFYPDSVPELVDEPPDLLVEFIDSDVFAAVNQLLDDVCADRRRMEREVSSSTIYGAIVRRSASLRSSQDEPAVKRQKHTRSSTHGDGGEFGCAVVAVPPSATAVAINDAPPTSGVSKGLATAAAAPTNAAAAAAAAAAATKLEQPSGGDSDSDMDVAQPSVTSDRNGSLLRLPKKEEAGELELNNSLVPNNAKIETDEPAPLDWPCHNNNDDDDDDNRKANVAPTRPTKLTHCDEPNVKQPAAAAAAECGSALPPYRNHQHAVVTTRSGDGKDLTQIERIAREVLGSVVTQVAGSAPDVV